MADTSVTGGFTKIPVLPNVEEWLAKNFATSIDYRNAEAQKRGFTSYDEWLTSKTPPSATDQEFIESYQKGMEQARTVIDATIRLAPILARAVTELQDEVSRLRNASANG